MHGLVLDEKGQKMSKSKGNVINPIEMITEYGSDALRLGIIASRSAGQNQEFSSGKVLAGRNFCNKLWNIARFTENKLGEVTTLQNPTPTSIADHWIIRELNQAMDDIENQLSRYRFAEAGETVYHAIWDDVADWYVEVSKKQTNPEVLAWVLDTCLKIAHPFAPFVTETIWQTLPWCDDLLITAKWPTKLEFNDIRAEQFARMQDFVAETRFVIAELPGDKKYDLLYQNDSLIDDNVDLVKGLVKLNSVTKTDQPFGLRLAISGREAWLDISEKTLSKHKKNLEARLADTNQQIKKLEERLANETYLQKAPAKLVEESRSQLSQKQELIEHLTKELDVIE